MKKWRTILLICIALAGVLGLGAPAMAQREPVSVEIQTSPRMYVGEQVEFYVVVHGSRNAEPPDLSAITDMEFVYRGPQDSSMTQVTITNGQIEQRVTTTYKHLYTAIPKRVGMIVIPAFTLIVDGKAVSTQAVKIEVLRPKEATGYSLDLTVDRTTAFVGQPIQVTLTWTLGGQSENPSMLLPIEGAEAEIQLGSRTAGLNQRGQQAFRLAVNGQAVLAQYNGLSLVLDRVVIPKRAGTITIGAARVDFAAVLGMRPRGPLDSPFDDRGRAIVERQYSLAPQIVIKVEDLPAEGRPADFSGLVGSYGIATGVDETQVSVGDPINLAVNVTGPYPLSMVPPLNLTRQAALKGEFRVPRDPVLAAVLPQAAVFGAIIRPRSEKVTQVGPLTLSYFDPDARAYKTARSIPIPITVRATGSVTLPEGFDEPVEAPKAEPERRPGGLADIIREGQTEEDGGSMPDVLQSLRSPSTLAILIAPPALCLACWGGIGLRRWRTRDAASARRRAALRALRRGLRAGDGVLSPWDQAARALTNFAADWFDEPRDTLTAVHASDLLGRTGTAASGRLAELLRECDAVRFGRAHAQTPEGQVRDRAIEAAREYARQWRSTGRAAA